MIYKNATWSEVENMTIAEFGNGTILIGSSEDAATKNKLLIMKQSEPRPIGEDCNEEYKSTDEFKPDLVVVFKNKAGFDVFFNHCLNLKEIFDSELSEQHPEEVNEWNEMKSKPAE